MIDISSDTNQYQCQYLNHYESPPETLEKDQPQSLSSWVPDSLSVPISGK